LQLRWISREPARLGRLAERGRLLVYVWQQLAGQLAVEPPHHVGGVKVLEREPP
jgi:hypothetical protein